MLPIRLGRETVRLPVAAIDWVDAAGDYMCVHAEGRTHVVRATMKQFEERLDPADFQRIHRSTIVNLRRIRKLKPHTNGEYFLTLDGGHELKLSPQLPRPARAHPRQGLKRGRSPAVSGRRRTPRRGRRRPAGILPAPAEEELENHDEQGGDGVHATEF